MRLRMIQFCCLVVGLVGLIWRPSAQADTTTTYNLGGFAFDTSSTDCAASGFCGGTASGSFTYDATTNTITTWSITTSADTSGFALSAFTYDSTNSTAQQALFSPALNAYQLIFNSPCSATDPQCSFLGNNGVTGRSFDIMIPTSLAASGASISVLTDAGCNPAPVGCIVNGQPTGLTGFTSEGFTGGNPFPYRDLGGTASLAASTTAPVPEPSSLVLIGTGILGASFRARRRNQTAAEMGTHL